MMLATLGLQGGGSDVVPGDFEIEGATHYADYETYGAFISAETAWESGNGTGEFVLGDYIMCDKVNPMRDTAMLCLDGCLMEGDCSWSKPHADETDSGCEHIRGYKWIACLKMIAEADGNENIPQDAIAHYINETTGNETTWWQPGQQSHVGDPINDFDHWHAYGYDDAERALNWIFDTARGSARVVYDHADMFNPMPPQGVVSIQSELEPGYPILACPNGGDPYVIYGYAQIEVEGGEETWLLVHEPGPPLPGALRFNWVLADTARDYSDIYIFPPKGNRMYFDLDQYTNDTDEDGIVDFDETERFKTDPTAVDTDVDGVHDLQDIVGYVFNLGGSYNLRERDIDGDGKPKELDKDNDHPNDDGQEDGCEDHSQDGFTPAGESDPFNADDDWTIFGSYCYKGSMFYTSRASGQTGDEFFGWERLVLMESTDTNPWSNELHWLYDPFATAGNLGMGAFVRNTPSEARGTAKVTIEQDDLGRYWIRTESNPQQARISTELTVAGLPDMNTTWDQDVPLFFSNAIIGPCALRDGASGGQYLGGRIDVANLGMYQDLPAGENIPEATRAEEDVALGFLEWHIWINYPDYEL